MASLTTENQLALKLMMVTGMRITDALELTWSTISVICLGPKDTPAVLHYVERKTGKDRFVTLPLWLCEQLRARMKLIAKKSPWVFPGRDRRKHRTRQAVWKDLKNVSKRLGVQENLGTHTARKIFAVTLYNEAMLRGDYNPMETVQRELNHRDPAVTALYALSDIMSARGNSRTNLTF